MYEDDYEVNIMDILYKICTKWRKILLVTLIGCFLCGIYGSYDVLKVKLNKDNYNKAYNDYISKQEDINKKNNLLNNEITEYISLRDSKNEYIENSYFMSINPNDEYSVTITLFVDLKNDDNNYENTTVGYETRKALFMFQDIIVSEMYISFADKINIEPRYIYDIVSCDISYEASTIKTTIKAKNKNDAQIFSDIAVDFINSRVNEIKECEFKISKYFIQIVDNDTSSKQNEYAEELSNYTKKITELEKQIDANNASMPVFNYSTKACVKRVLKYMFIGALACCFAIVCWYGMSHLLSTKINSSDYFNNRKINIISSASIFEEKPQFGSKIDSFIKKLFGYRDKAENFDDSIILAANSIKLLSNEKTIGIVSECNNDLVNNVKDILNANSKQKYVVVGNIVNNPTSVNEISKCKDIILLTELDVSNINEVDSLIARIKDFKKDLLGSIVVTHE